MRFLLSIALLMFATTSSAVDFTKLSRSEPISTTYPASFKCYVDVDLFLNLGENSPKPIYLILQYTIGADTIHDRIQVSDNINNVVKQLFLDEEERLTVSVFLNNEEIDVVKGIEGSLRIVRNPDFKPTEDQGKTTFLSNVWKSDQTPLFRIVNNDSVAQYFRLKLELTEQFEFDRLYFKMKVISPADGIVVLNKSIQVNESYKLTMRPKSFSLDMKEVDMTIPGTYYFQVIPNMMSNRVNGINKIDYEIVRE